MRAHEMASLRLGDVLGEDGRVRDEITLDPSQTKGRRSRRVFINAKLKKELGSYVKAVCVDRRSTDPLFRSQKGRAFSGNTMCQLFGNIYDECGLNGASKSGGMCLVFRTKVTCELFIREALRCLDIEKVAKYEIAGKLLNAGGIDGLQFVRKLLDAGGVGGLRLG